MYSFKLADFNWHGRGILTYTSIGTVDSIVSNFQSTVYSWLVSVVIIFILSMHNFCCEVGGGWEIKISLRSLPLFLARLRLLHLPNVRSTAVYGY